MADGEGLEKRGPWGWIQSWDVDAWGAGILDEEALFAALKMGMTSLSIILMVVLARYRFMRLLRVEWVLYGVLIAYASLISYEVWMLKGPVQLPIL